jgi:heterotetrameric sarcosine oxidase gamma subunit
VGDFLLKAEPFLGGYSQDFGLVELAEITNLSIVSLAMPINGLTAFTTAIKTALGAPLPTAGMSHSVAPFAHLLRMSPDQFLALLPAATAPTALIKNIGAAGYCTDQTDNWVILRIKGPSARTALERICPVDIDPHAFPQGAFARTMMEHLGTIILNEGSDSFLLLSACSSSGSFLHAVETSIKNIL